jgi:beta-lactamase superfamily II metal-dependent hydrolase
MNALRVRIYDVKFGDAMLISVPRSNGDYDHVLIDVGNVASGEGGDNSVFIPVVEDVLTVLDGTPLHLYISTHEHLDHVQGLLYAAREMQKESPSRDLKSLLQVERVWLSASAAPDYYERFPDAEKQKKLRAGYFAGLDAAGLGLLPMAFQAMAANNNPGKTGDCVDFVRGLVDTPTYVHRGIDADALHQLQDVRIRVLAPEEDASVYYRASPRHMGSLDIGRDDGELDGLGKVASAALPAAPAGVDAMAFRNLWEQLRDGSLEEVLLQIDKAANNTSIVFELNWAGWTLLFTGDAELRSWEQLSRHGVLAPAHFLKVSHHGSHNGTPDEDILDQVLPSAYAGERWVVVSSCDGTYGGIPHAPTDAKLRARAQHFLHTKHDNLSIAPSGARYIDVAFPASGP